MLIGRTCAAVVLVAAALVGPARADAPAVQDRGARRHDGFYLHLVLGAGYTSAVAGAGGTDFSFHGGSGMLALRAGGAVRDDLILFGELFVDTMSPEPQAGSARLHLESDVSLNTAGLGAGAARYLSPYNVHVGGLVWLGALSADRKGGQTIATSRGGGGVQITAGKEWWVSRQWGLGVEARLTLGTFRDNPDPVAPSLRWTVRGLNVGVTGTFN